MSDTLTARRRKAKLGMTVQPKKPTPYDTLADEMQKGAKAQTRLERKPTPYQMRLQKRIPKITPTGRKGATKA